MMQAKHFGRRRARKPRPSFPQSKHQMRGRVAQGLILPKCRSFHAIACTVTESDFVACGNRPASLRALKTAFCLLLAQSCGGVGLAALRHRRAYHVSELAERGGCKGETCHYH